MRSFWSAMFFQPWHRPAATFCGTAGPVSTKLSANTGKSDFGLTFGILVRSYLRCEMFGWSWGGGDGHGNKNNYKKSRVKEVETTRPS